MVNHVTHHQRIYTPGQRSILKHQTKTQFFIFFHQRNVSRTRSPDWVRDVTINSEIVITVINHEKNKTLPMELSEVLADFSTYSSITVLAGISVRSAGLQSAMLQQQFAAQIPRFAEINDPHIAYHGSQIRKFLHALRFSNFLPFIALRATVVRFKLWTYGAFSRRATDRLPCNSVMFRKLCIKCNDCWIRIR